MCPSTGCFGHVDNSISGTSSIFVTSTVKILEISWRTPLIFLDLIVKSCSFSNISLQLPASAIRWNQAIGIEITTDRTTKNWMIIFFDFSISYSKFINKDFWSIRLNHVTYSESREYFLYEASYSSDEQPNWLKDIDRLPLSYKTKPSNCNLSMSRMPIAYMLFHQEALLDADWILIGDSHMIWTVW